jgi:GDP-L-fucose synthase
MVAGTTLCSLVPVPFSQGLRALQADVTLRELAETIARVTGFRGVLDFDPSKPDGFPRKLLAVSRLKALGWEATIGLEDGLRDA